MLKGEGDFWFAFKWSTTHTNAKTLGSYLRNFRKKWALYA